MGLEPATLATSPSGASDLNDSFAADANDDSPHGSSTPPAPGAYHKTTIEIDPDASVAVIRHEIAQRQQRRKWGAIVSTAVLLILIVGLVVAIGYTVAGDQSSSPTASPSKADEPDVSLDSIDNINDDPFNLIASKGSSGNGEIGLDGNDPRSAGDVNGLLGGLRSTRETESGADAAVVPSPPFRQSAQSPPALSSPPQRPNYQFHKSNQVEDVWTTAKPYLVSLSIEGPSGKLPAVGTIVDSRGWVATSLHLVRDAWRIEVTASGNPLDRADGESPLTDQVRGFVLQDETMDLAVLAVNPRFVLNFADLKLAPENRLVRNMALLMAAPPSITNYFGVSETQVEQRGKSRELPEVAQARLVNLRLDQLEHTWLSFKGGSEILPGTPVFDGSGTLQAIVRFNKNGLVYALPVDQLKSRLGKVSGQLSPLQRPLVSVAPGREVRLGLDHPARPLVQAMNQKAGSCRDFGWIAQSADQFQSVQDFAIAYVACVEYMNQLPLSPQSSGTEPSQQQLAREWIENTITELEQEIRDRWQQAVAAAEPQIKTMSELATNALSQKNLEIPFIPLLGTVFDQVSNLDFWVISINDGQAYTIADFDPRLPVMRPGTRWFMIVEQQKSDGLKRISYGDDKQLTAHPIRPLLILGPLRD